MLKFKTNLKQMNNKRTLINLYKDIVLSDPSAHFLYDVVYQQHIKIVIQIHAIQIYQTLIQSMINKSLAVSPIWR